MLHYHNIPLKLWAEAIHIAVYLLNKTINTQVGFTTPYELWFHTKPSVSHYRIFGIVAYIFIDKSLHTKFQAKGHKVIFVGYSDTSKGWRFWNPSTDKITESSDVIFDEHNGYPSFTSTHTPSVTVPTQLYFPSPPLSLPIPPVANFIPPVAVIDPMGDAIAEPVGNSDSSAALPPLDDPYLTSSHSSLPTYPDPSDSPDFSSSFHSDPYYFTTHFDSYSTPISTDEPIQPKFKSLTELYSDPPPSATSPSAPLPFDTPSVSPLLSYANMISSAESYREPATYHQATMSPQAQLWKEAMNRE